MKASAPLVVRKLQRAFATLSGFRFVRFVDEAGSDLDPAESMGMKRSWPFRISASKDINVRSGAKLKMFTTLKTFSHVNCLK